MTATQTGRRRIGGAYQLATWSVASAVLVVLTIATIFFLEERPKNEAAAVAPLSEPRRAPVVAVLPLEPDSWPAAIREQAASSDIASFSGALVARLGAPTRADKRRLSVLGPGATRLFRVASSGDRSQRLRLLHRELGADSVISGRIFEREQGWQLLVEVVRASDGAHLWLQAFDLDTPVGEIADQTATVVRDLYDE